MTIAARGALALLLSALFLSPGPARAEETISYSGAATISMSILYQGALTAFEKKTGVRFGLVDSISGTGKGLERLRRGEVNLAGSARALTEEETKAGLVGVVIGYDAVGLWVNRANPVQRLSRAQAGAIFTGKIRNWKEVGGKDEVVSLFIEPPDSRKATVTVVNQTLMNSAPFPPDRISLFEYPRDALVALSHTENAIAPASIGLRSSLNQRIADRIRPLALDGVTPSFQTVSTGGYPLRRPLLLVTLGEAKGLPRRFIDFMLSPEGQALVGKNFVPTRSR